MPANSDSQSRYSLSLVMAALPTVALLYLMTRLIVPEEGDPIVSEMIGAFELRQIPRMVDTAVRRRERELEELREFRPLKRSDFVPDESQETGEFNGEAPDESQQATDSTDNADQQSGVDWWLQIQNYIDEMSEEDLRQWRLSNGYDNYVSVMQGSIPSSPYPEAPRVTADPIGTSYSGSSGKTEIRISENCIVEVDNSALAGIDPGMRIPNRADCKPQRSVFDRDDLNR